MKKWDVVLEQHYPNVVTFKVLRTLETRDGALEWARMWVKLHHMDLPMMEINGHTVTISLVQ